MGTILPLKNTTMIDGKQLDFDFYFWLGEDGETAPVSEEDFRSRQDKIRLDRDNFLNVRIDRTTEGNNSRDGIDVGGD